MTTVVAIFKGLTRSAVARARARLPIRRETIETAAGALLICGFALIGLVLPALP
jgi:hypothetical protein